MKKFLSLLCILTVAISFTACGKPERDPSGISLEEFEKISTGMTYDEVVDIVGGEGTEVSERENNEDDYIEYIDVYKFNGEAGGYAEFEFTKISSKKILEYDISAAKLTSKTQHDLS